jgi:hypothetical protein
LTFVLEIAVEQAAQLLFPLAILAPEKVGMWPSQAPLLMLLKVLQATLCSEVAFPLTALLVATFLCLLATVVEVLAVQSRFLVELLLLVGANRVWCTSHLVVWLAVLLAV